MKIKIFSWIWRHWLKERDRNGKVYYHKVIKIKGWRTAIVKNYWGGHSTNTFMFPWEFCGRPWWQVKQQFPGELKQFIINLFA